jgi:hypothetical protein
MAKRIHSAVSARRRKLQAAKQVAFAVAHDFSGRPVSLTIFSGRRALSRELSCADAHVLVQLLTQTSLLPLDLQSKAVCELSLRRPFSTFWNDTHA